MQPRSSSFEYDTDELLEEWFPRVDGKHNALYFDGV